MQTRTPSALASLAVLSTVVLGALALVPGIPLALVAGRPQRRWSGVLVDALLLGTVWYLLLALVEAHAGWYGRGQVAVVTLGLVAVLARPAAREARVVPRPAVTWFAAALAGVTVIALALRRDPFYFLYQIGDFGEYVNSANVLADGGGFSPWFTHGFGVALSLSKLALGEARTVDLVPYLGIVLLLATVALAERLGASRPARLVVAVVLAVGVVPVWFSRFPASESLYAVLQLGMVLFVVEAVQRSSHRLALAAGAFAGVLLVVRGNGLLLGPIVVAVLLIGALVVGRRALAVLTTFAVSSLLALAAAFVFNARYSYGYFIEFQLPRYVPDLVFDQLEGMGGLRFAAPRAAVLVVGCALLAIVARASNERFGPSKQSLAWLRRAVLPAVVVVLLAALLTVLDTRGLVDALARYAVAVEVLGAVGVGVALWRFADRMDDDERVGVLLVVLAGGAFALLFAHRLPTPRYAPYYLYWDRYLFSELFPVMVLAAIWAISWLEARRVPAVAIVVGTAALGVSLHRDGDLTREHRFMGDAYAELGDVAELVDADLPIVFSGVAPDDAVDEIYHPNSHRVIGLPLGQTFERRFLNIGIHPYAPDPRPTVAEIADALSGHGVDVAYLLQVGAGDDVPRRPDGGDALVVRPAGSTTVEIPMLDRPIDGRRAAWWEARFNVVVSTITVR